MFIELYSFGIIYPYSDIDIDLTKSNNLLLIIYWYSKINAGIFLINNDLINSPILIGIIRNFVLLFWIIYSINFLYIWLSKLHPPFTIWWFNSFVSI